ncbi:MAG: hypothetical protein Unbinned1966contig1000_3 [Prokaryotic dsDNA virus sp.]|nr:MAG: hypothetical protein Unbinned1966contig1000_3 [Prokaryotic dsDNA virus sp.]|tara:strand:+ start:1158 stop:1655 length:498 start_codon:yes stop_codon:yes gene_type:complete
MSNGYDAATIGEELYSWERSGGSIQDYFTNFLTEQGWLEDSWTDDPDVWWMEYGSFVENIGSTWDQESFDFIEQLRDLETEEFQLGFMPPEEKMGATGFAEAANIGTTSSMGGDSNFVEDYNAGYQPINTKFQRSQESAWANYGQSYLDMFTNLMSMGAFSEDPD